MIVRNEEEYLDNCLKNIKWPINEIIIVDTGSTDKTIEIAQKYTSKIFFRKFNDDFSEVRNYSIQKASNAWILVLDADESIDNDDISKFPEIIQKMELEGIFGAKLWNYNYYKNAGWSVRATSRLFKRRDDIFYERNVNETVSFSIEKLSPCLLYSPVKIHHYGFMKDDKYTSSKHVRYTNMLKYAIDNNEKSLYYYYAKEHFLKREFNQALHLCEQALRIKEKKRLYNLIGDIYFELNDFQRAKENYLKVRNMENDEIKERTDRRYPYPTKFYIHATNRLAEVYYLEANFNVASKELEDLLRSCDYLAHIHINLALVYEKLNRFSDALIQYNYSIHINPNIINLKYMKKLENHVTDTFKAFQGIETQMKSCVKFKAGLPDALQKNEV